MPILDYTTTVPEHVTVAEIEAKLAKAKAEAILKEYDNNGIVSWPCPLRVNLFAWLIITLSAEADEVPAGSVATLQLARDMARVSLFR